ncbi:hypothetical protein EDD16DRAFT_494331 [Pisolithus croceorrhizus]|nr:hypothetical protein EDD16DRAFT_494331 [Pisolithus croceorrhizus]
MVRSFYNCMVQVFFSNISQDVCAFSCHFTLVIISFCQFVPSICHHPQSLKMPKLFTTMTNSTLYVAEHGIGSILVFEYLYFLLQARDDQDGLQEHLTLAVERYQKVW